MIEQIEAGKTQILTEHALTLLWLYTDSGFSDALSNSVVCGFYLPRQREFLRRNPAIVEQWAGASSDLFEGLGLLCKEWQVPASRLSNEELLDIELPVMLLAGGQTQLRPRSKQN